MLEESDGSIAWLYCSALVPVYKDDEFWELVNKPE